MQCREHCLHFKLNDKEKPLELLWKNNMQELNDTHIYGRKPLTRCYLKNKEAFFYSPLFCRGWSDEANISRQEISLLLEIGFTVNTLANIEPVCWGWRGGARMNLTSERGREIIAAGSDWYKSVQCTSDISLPMSFWYSSHNVVEIETCYHL